MIGASWELERVSSRHYKIGEFASTTCIFFLFTVLKRWNCGMMVRIGVIGCSRSPELAYECLLSGIISHMFNSQ